MSYKLFVIKAAKPIAAVLAVSIGGFGYREWKKDKEALHITNNINEMVSLFDKYDKDHSGSIEKRDLRAALEQAGVKVSELQLDLMMMVADEDHDGKISREEWVHICQKVATPDNQHPLHVPNPPVHEPSVLSNPMKTKEKKVK